MKEYPCFSLKIFHLAISFLHSFICHFDEHEGVVKVVDAPHPRMPRFKLCSGLGLVRAYCLVRNFISCNV
ncbi:hypothetical protein GQ457_01G041390 [Hibiscus cannabinus]